MGQFTTKQNNNTVLLLCLLASLAVFSICLNLPRTEISSDIDLQLTVHFTFGDKEEKKEKKENVTSFFYTITQKQRAGG